MYNSLDLVTTISGGNVVKTLLSGYHLAKTKQYVWSVSLRTCSIKQNPLGKSWVLNICVKSSDFDSHQALSPVFKGSNSERK